ncbi:class I SAM-dependent methyltransferase [Acidimicrobiia bacterium]|jgi:ubiquinone/menaquinone biosynthesis C-methylase UbiE|nr:class I SAM-dependent methyltransferase [Acidimicrobiia bacterium]
MKRKNFENWWSENLFSDKTEYQHLGQKFRMPSLEEFSESWMGSINEEDRIEVRKNFRNFKSLLDVGCGGSPEFYGIQKKYKKLKYTGLDITPEIVQYNLDRGINCVIGSANNIPFDNSTFDIVHSRHVIEHMQDFKKPLEEMIRVARYIVLIPFFIDPIESGESIKSLDNEGTEFEIYHNQYSKSEISEFLDSNIKVKGYKYLKLKGLSKTLLKIKVKNSI